MKRSRAATTPPGAENATPRGQEILAIATQLFYRNGYSAVGMRMIADAAGVRPASIYHHFESKERMLFDVILEITRDFMEAHLPILDEEGPYSGRFERLLRAHIRYFWEHRYSMSVGLREMRHLSNAHQLQVRKYRTNYQRRIQTFIREGVEAGEFTTSNPSLAGLVVLDLVNGVNGWFNPRGALTIDEVAEHHVRLAMDGILLAVSTSIQRDHGSQRRRSRPSMERSSRSTPTAATTKTAERSRRSR